MQLSCLLEPCMQLSHLLGPPYAVIQFIEAYAVISLIGAPVCSYPINWSPVYAVIPLIGAPLYAVIPFILKSSVCVCPIYYNFVI